MNQERLQGVLSLLVQLLGWLSTIIGWALVVCAVLVCAWILQPYLYRKFWRVRVYYDSKDGELTSHSFRAEDLGHLWNKSMVGRSVFSPRRPAGYYFFSDITPEDARKELQKVAAHRAAERAAEYERRPKLSLSEQVELPTFEATFHQSQASGMSYSML